ncbi:OmpA family protein [Haliscomenobacter hydrossis]|uniref:OmpA/MotB domain protein n=1 Tax=Haliscomenobacter hydrossis (strain ATCC 27775 / DSM 1100 / LMG 10767 / O) TaxID=760192 RepID=F4L4W9_HALH1|nr:OmpA family protein [Haliscomenobacter hydrossis]AEE54031.1 OmpA/MotB domain protein [Haliscomenobacter hydrossis DSM 1100]
MKAIFSVISLSLLFLLSACSVANQVRDGKTAYEAKQYKVAVGLLQKEFNKAKTRLEKGKIAYMLGLSLKATNQSEQAIDWFQKAYDNQAGTDALKEMAQALKMAGRYADAKEAYKNLGIEIGSPYEYRKEIAACDVAEGWKKIKTPEYSVEPATFNSKYADYAPVFFKDQLVITSDRATATGDKKVYAWTGNDFSDLFAVNTQTGDASNFSAAINTMANEGTATFNANFTEVFFTRCTGTKKEDQFCKIMHSVFDGTSWIAPEPLSFQQAGINYGQPCLSADGKTLYYSALHPDGWGGHDIWMSERVGSEWTEPKLLPRTINTLGDELFPSLDNDTLYFSSDTHPGMGGLDIFKTYRLKNGDWAPAFNLKPPINSMGDDFGFLVDYQSKRDSGVTSMGYFTSSRSEGQGNDDIYTFERRYVPPPPPPPVAERPKEEPKAKLILDGFVLEKIFQDANNPNSKVLGRKPLPESKVDIKIGNKTETITVDAEGHFRLELSENLDYNFLASHPGYLNNSAKFSTKGIAKDPKNPEQIFEIEIVLDKIYLDKEIRLENIYYDLDKWDIRADAQPTLDKLAETLKLNPKVRIQLSSHTDCRGTDVYNESLSQKRAQSAVDYLISKGIEAQRLEARGYGEGVPEATCACARCSEDEHQLNRRTAFRVVE